MAPPPETTLPETTPAGRRPPTAAEARAVGHPLRMRIMFACRDRPRTNKQLAAALGATPGTIHYHLKQLVEQGFLRAEESRPGPRGSTEKPYRSTGKSWQLTEPVPGGVSRTLRQVGAEEVLEARAADVVMLTRLGLTLSEAGIEELRGRLDELVEEFAERSAATAGPSDGEAAGEAVTLFVALHRPGDPEAI